MFDLNIRRSTDSSLIPVNIASLAVQVSGDVRIPGEERGATHNGKSPAVIVRCATMDDVLQCLDFASRRGLLISMRNAHLNPTEWTDCEHGIAVDLGALSRIAGN